MEAQSQVTEAGIPGIWRMVQLVLFLFIENPWIQNRSIRKKISPDFSGGRHRTSTFSGGQSVILLQQSSMISNLTIPFPARYCTGICLGNRQGLGFSKWISPFLSPFPYLEPSGPAWTHSSCPTFHSPPRMLPPPCPNPYLNQVHPSNLTLSLTPPGLAPFLSFYYS